MSSKPKTMPKSEALELTASIKRDLHTLPDLIHRAHKGNAHLALDYKTIAEWAKAEFGLSRSRIYQVVAWKTVEIELHEACNLPEDWELVEATCRLFTGDKLDNLVAIAVLAIEGIDDAAKRGSKVKQVVLDEKNRLDAIREGAKAAKAAKAKADATQKASTADKAPIVPITAVPLNFELLKAKADDTAKVLAAVAAETVADDSLLVKLQDARTVLDEMIAFVGGEAK